MTKVISRHSRMPRKVKGPAKSRALQSLPADHLRLLKENEELFKETVAGRALLRKEEADRILSIATDPLELARGREMLKSAQWDLERICRRVFGQEAVNINLNLNRDLGDRLRRARERVFENDNEETE